MRLIVCLTICCASFSCLPVSKTSNISQNGLNYLALGDSYTIGESVDEPLRWPNQLVDSLADYGFHFNKAEIIATTGWTTDELLTGIEDVNPDSNYDLVSLLIGVNNQYRGYNLAIYRTEFEELLRASIDFAQGDASRVFVVSIPNYGVTPFGQSQGEERIRNELLSYDAVAESISASYGVAFVNITPISEEAKVNPSLIASDRLHPSGSMYTRWVEKVLPVAKNIMAEQ